MEMLRKEWIDPNGIYLPKPMNPRPINQGFIGSLVDSMNDQGFLPQYPVKVARALELTCIEPKNSNGEDLLFAGIAGMHRITAAQIAKIDKILCEVYSVDDDAYIEMMMTDNFDHDPARNSKLGQVFSKTEKRKACCRLLYIPKYFKKTDTALAEAWHTAPSNVARWRKEVVATFAQPDDPSPNGEGGQPTFPETLRRMGITPERLQELRDIDASREREDAEGNVVPVRKPPTDASEKDKDTFFDQIRREFCCVQEEADLNFDWETVKHFAAQKWNVESIYNMYGKLHINHLRQLHEWVIEKDAAFITACEAIETERKALTKTKEKFEKTIEKTQRVFAKLIGADNKYSDTFKANWDPFETLVKAELGIETFGNTRWDYEGLETADDYAAATSHHVQVQEAIEKGADWIADFVRNMREAAAQKREKVSEKWTQTRQAALAAIEAYPRDISFDRLIATAAKELYKSHDFFTKIFDAETVSTQKHIGTLEDEIKTLERLIKQIKNDEDWVAKIPAVKVEGTGGTGEAGTVEILDTLTTEAERYENRIFEAIGLANDAILDSEDSWFFTGDQQDFKEICDRAGEILTCDPKILFEILYKEEISDELSALELAKWDTILRQIHSAVEAKAAWLMAEPLTDDADAESARQPSEFALTADDLHAISLEDIFQHIADRVICVDGLFDENEVMADMARVLGNASRGQVGTQLYLLMKFALFIQPKSDIEGNVPIEKTSPFDEGEAAD